MEGNRHKIYFALYIQSRFNDNKLEVASPSAFWRRGAIRFRDPSRYLARSGRSLNSQVNSALYGFEAYVFELLLQIGRYLQCSCFMTKVVASAFETFFEPREATFLLVQQLDRLETLAWRRSGRLSFRCYTTAKVE